MTDHIWFFITVLVISDVLLVVMVVDLCLKVWRFENKRKRPSSEGDR